MLVAHNGHDVARHLRELTPERSAKIGEAARARVLAEHTYAHRVTQLEQVLGEHLEFQRGGWTRRSSHERHRRAVPALP